MSMCAPSTGGAEGRRESRSYKEGAKGRDAESNRMSMHVLVVGADLPSVHRSSLAAGGKARAAAHGFS